MTVIFLAGVHGVGKSYLGAPAAKKLGIPHFIASELIREEKGLATWSRDKNTSNLDDNQRALIQAVDKRRAHNCLLDGHFVLRNADGLVTPIESSVFKQLQLQGVVLLTEEPQVIADRLTIRDNHNVDIQSVVDLATAELTHAQHVCEKLKLPLLVIHSPTQAQVVESINSLMNL